MSLPPERRTEAGAEDFNHGIIRFEKDNDEQRARLYITSRGIYGCRVNGKIWDDTKHVNLPEI